MGGSPQSDTTDLSGQFSARAWDLPWKGPFLEALATTGIVANAARAVRKARSTVYEARDTDEVFAAAWREAEEWAADLLEEEARRRSVDGWDEPVFHQGERCGVVRKYSDRLLELLLKSRRPERFRERHQVEHTGNSLAAALSGLGNAGKGAEGEGSS